MHLSNCLFLQIKKEKLEIQIALLTLSGNKNGSHAGCSEILYFKFTRDSKI